MCLASYSLETQSGECTRRRASTRRRSTRRWRSRWSWPGRSRTPSAPPTTAPRRASPCTSSGATAPPTGFTKVSDDSVCDALLLFFPFAYYRHRSFIRLTIGPRDEFSVRHATTTPNSLSLSLSLSLASFPADCLRTRLWAKLTGPAIAGRH